MISIVHVGALPIDGQPAYMPLVKAPNQVIAIDPQFDMALPPPPHTVVKSVAVGNGDTRTLFICQQPGMSSLFEPDTVRLAMFDGFLEFGAVIECRKIRTRPLAELVDRIDLLVIDAQGSELMVLFSAGTLLRRTMAVQVEVPFVSLYRKAPSFAAIDALLRCEGFIPHKYVAIDSRGSQLLSADLLYTRDPFTSDGWSADQLANMSLIAECYGSHDLAASCLSVS